MAAATNGTQRKLSPFGQLIRQMRTTHGWSQAVVARRAGITPGYVGLIETGERGEKPALDIVKRIAQALECTIEETEGLMRAGGHLGPDEHLIDGTRPTIVNMIKADPVLTEEQKHVVIAVYRAYRPDA